MLVGVGVGRGGGGDRKRVIAGSKKGDYIEEETDVRGGIQISLH